jgi:hypothetical protein
MIKWALHQVLHAYANFIYLDYTILSLQQLWYYFLNYVYPNPPRLSTSRSCVSKSEPRRKRTTFGRAFTDSFHLFSSHTQRWRRLFWRLRHRSLSPSPDETAELYLIHTKQQYVNSYPVFVFLPFVQNEYFGKIRREHCSGRQNNKDDVLSWSWQSVVINRMTWI